jgi:hypothetical protein
MLSPSVFTLLEGKAHYELEIWLLPAIKRTADDSLSLVGTTTQLN